MGYTEQLFRAQDAALERAYMASLQPPDDYYYENDRDTEQDCEEEEVAEE